MDESNALSHQVGEKNQLMKCQQTLLRVFIELWENQQRTKVLHEAHEEEASPESKQLIRKRMKLRNFVQLKLNLWMA